MSVETYTANTHSASASVFRDRLRASVEGGTRTFVWRVKRGDGELAIESGDRQGNTVRFYLPPKTPPA